MLESVGSFERKEAAYALSTEFRLVQNLFAFLLRINKNS